jgi:hypothetical protein
MLPSCPVYPNFVSGGAADMVQDPPPKNCETGPAGQILGSANKE